MSDYTPTTEEVRSDYAEYGYTGPNKLRAERFDRWLAALRRAERAAVLRKAAEDYDRCGWVISDVEAWLTKHADALEAEEPATSGPIDFTGASA